MPLKNEVPKLVSLCICYVENNLPQYRAEALESIPHSLCEDLIQLLHKNMNHHYSMTDDGDILLKPNIKKLWLPYCRKLNEELHANTLTRVLELQIAENLTYLKCEIDFNVAEIDLYNLVRSIPNIVILDLNNNRTNDIILRAIGDNCEKLEILKLNSTELTDDGIRQLCESRSRGAKLKYLCLKTLERITKEGCLTALLNLTQLQKFCGSSIIDAFKILFEDVTFPLTQFKLRKLSCAFVNESVPNGFLNFLIRSCPNLSFLTITCGNLSATINELNNCDTLVPLNLNAVECLNQTMNLTDIGLKLKKLHLSDCEIEIFFIGFCCPNLRKLELTDVTYAFVADNVKKASPCIAFTHLRELVLRSDEESEDENSFIRIPDMRFILENCHDLQELVIIGQKQVTDEIMSSLFFVNSLSRLEYFLIEDCAQLTNRVVLDLLKMENNLKKIEVNNCGRFKRQDRNRTKSYIKENNLNTCANFYSYYEIDRERVLGYYL